MALKRSSIAEKLQSELGFPKHKALQTIESLLELIKEALESGEAVLISGFGKFNVLDKRERKGRNPATGQKMTLRSRRVVKFRCSGKLRDKINA